MIAGREQAVGSAMLIEREHLLPLAEEDFDLVEVSFPTVNNLGQVKACPERSEGFARKLTRRQSRPARECR